MKEKRILLSISFFLVSLIFPKKAEAPIINSLAYPLEIKKENNSYNINEILGEEFFIEINKKIEENNPIDYKTNDFRKDSDEVLLARMLLGEAESCSQIEKIAIAYTALNRASDNKDWNGRTLQEAILKPRQYSAFNSDRNAKLKNPLAYNKKEFLDCLQIAKEILAGKYQDPTNGATYYLNPNHPDLAGKTLPTWTKNMIKIGRIQNSYHIFFKEP